MKVLFKLIICSLVLKNTCAYNDEIINTIRNRGHEAEKHFVTTKDNYVLGLYRIPCRRCVRQTFYGETSVRSPVMLMVHGIIASGPAYILPKKNAAGYYFSNAGYDVWLASMRGTTYSRNHTTLNPNKIDYWKFSWHEMGIYDLPAIIDYILEQTQQKQLIYNGHSQGVASVLVMLSELPEYNKKIAMVHAMAPAVIFKYNHPAVVVPKTEAINAMEEWAQTENKFELFKYNSYLPMFLKTCMTPALNKVCKSLIFIIFGPGFEQFYEGLFVDISNHIPSGASYRQFMHFLQLMAAGKFQKFDYGEKKNLGVYGKTEPPEYNLSNVKTKVHILFGTNDWLIVPKNIPILAKKLDGNVIAVSEFTGFNHIDFTYAKNLKLVQDTILKVINEFLG